MKKFTRKYRPEERERIKAAFLQVLQTSCGILQPACDACSIDRHTISRWRQLDKVFDQACKDTLDLGLDLAENALLRQIQSGDTTAIIFYLKCKGKERGYIEKQKIETEITNPGLNITVQDQKTAALLESIKAGQK